MQPLTFILCTNKRFGSASGRRWERGQVECGGSETPVWEQGRVEAPGAVVLGQEVPQALPCAAAKAGAALPGEQPGQAVLVLGGLFSNRCSAGINLRMPLGSRLEKGE